METGSCVFILWSETTQQRLFTALTVLLMPQGRRDTRTRATQSTAAGPAPPCKRRPALSPHNTSCIRSLWILNYAIQTFPAHIEKHNLLWYRFNGKDYFFFKLAHYTQL